MHWMELTYLRRFGKMLDSYYFNSTTLIYKQIEKFHSNFTLGEMYERAHQLKTFTNQFQIPKTIFIRIRTNADDCFRFPNVVRVISMKFRAYFGLIKKLTVERLNY